MKKFEPLLDIIIPTWNNANYLDQCISSLYRLGVLGVWARAVIINNGDQPVDKTYAQDGRLRIVNAGTNLGWEGGLKLGLKQSNSRFVCFLNDDTFIPTSNTIFFQRLISPFVDKRIGAVGPVTTVSAGCQSVWHPQSPLNPSFVNWMIFFCVVVRREYLNQVGGIDDRLPGGDDFDLCFRMLDAGYKLVVDPGAFILHHAFVTGKRVRGDHTKPGGWNSPQMTEDVNHALIRKHGFKKFFTRLTNQVIEDKTITVALSGKLDKECEFIRENINGASSILELGCGSRKTIDNAIGLDRIAKGESLPHLYGDPSVADVVCDVTRNIPFGDNTQDVLIARHILEHCVDCVSTIREWRRVLKVGGRIHIACPNEQVTAGIPLNPEHVHAFEPKSLSSLMEVLGFKTVKSKDMGNGMSFVGVYEKC